MPDVSPGLAEASSSEFTDAVEQVELQFAALFTNAKLGLRRRASAIHPELMVSGYRMLSVLMHRGSG